MDCLFCKIVAGEIPSTKIYEDDLVLAFRDIDPKAPFHAVVIPKTHLASAADISADNSTVIAHLFEVIAEIARREKLDKGFRVVTNCGEEGGQTVGHLHFHLLAGRNLGWPPG
ncbi:histidine triad nucleotide-binding protein [Oscillospiraceae bacterium LTW-04]|nr:histidine triad nucleotide-binding protein [Oscillospiraceae bacterium MB24-C1]